MNPGKFYFLSLLFFGLIITRSQAATFYVDHTASGLNNGTSWANAYTSLANAVNAAHADLTIDTILVAQGVYYPESIPVGAQNRDKTFAFTRDGLTILGGYSSGGGSRNIELYPTILSGDLGTLNDSTDNAYHVVMVVGNQTTPLNNTLHFEGLIIEKGFSSVISSYNINSSPTFRNRGAGIFVTFASAVFKNCVFRNNSGTYVGGAIYNIDANLTLEACTGIYNTAEQGAGIAIQDGKLTVNQSRFSANTAGTYGGAISSYGARSDVLIVNSVISGNKANNSGGAIAASGSKTRIINSTLSGNTSTTSPAAIYHYNAGVSFITNSIIYGNSTPQIRNASGGGHYHYYSLIEGDSTTARGNLNGIAVNPAFINAPSYTTAPFIGGDYSLLNTSDCINAGFNDSIPAVYNSDFAGNNRILQQVIDIGAYEIIGAPRNVLYVDSAVAVSGNGLNWASAFKTLDEAITKAHINTLTDSILVAKGTYFPVRNAGTGSNPRDNAFWFTRDGLSVLGGYPTGGGTRDVTNHPTVLSGDLGTREDHADNAFHIIVAAGTSTQMIDSTLVIDGFTLINGNANVPSDNLFQGLNIQRNQGGAIYTRYSALTISNCIFRDNAAGNGGALFALESGASITQCSFHNNTASLYGGALDNVESVLKISSTTFRDNKANNGGAIRFQDAPTAWVTNTVFAGNEATLSGGAIYNEASESEYINCLFYGNAAATGGAISNYQASAPILVNTTISGNNAANGGGLYNADNVVVGLSNSIIYGNISGIENDLSSTYTSAYSLIQGDTTTIDGNLNGVTTDPLFVNAPLFSTAPFSSAADYTLSILSPCINAGDNNAVPSGIIHDLAGNDRIVSIAVDMGCYEKEETPCNLTLSATSTNLMCFGDSSGSIEVVVTSGLPPYEYAINNESYSSNHIFNNLPAGTYLITVKDAVSCIEEIEVTLSQPSMPLQSTSSVTDPVCFGTATGTIEVSVSGGSAPYAYDWSNDATTPQISDLDAGTYTLITTDNNGCLLYDTFYIEYPEDSLYIALGNDRTLCAQQTLLLNADIGVEGAVYEWASTNGFTSEEPQVSVSTAGTYNVTATTPEGCVISDDIIITRSEGIVVSDFVVTSQGFKDSIITLVNITDPKPDSIVWLLPPSGTVVSEQFGFAEISFADTGIYQVGMRAYMGECYEEQHTQIIIVTPSAASNPDVPRYPFIKAYNAYPNPSNGTFSVEIELQKEETISLKLIKAASGSIVNMRTETADKKNLIPYNTTLESGTYILLLETPYGSRSIKIEIL